jgi:SAM-dependent methyltransferase
METRQAMQLRRTCRGCGASELETFLDLGTMPLAGGFLPGPEAIAGERRFPLTPRVCSACGLVQIVEVVDPEVLFQEYSFSSSTIGPLVEHFERYAAWIHERFRPGLVVEFGCNDGVLLAPLERLGIAACGVDVSKNITELARGRGLDVVTGYFDEAIGQEIADRLGRADVVTGSNAFAHNDHPEEILRAARRVLKPEGHLCLEVMYAGDLLATSQWDTLYHEHLTFYCLTTLASLLRRHGFFVVDAERIPMHGGALRVTAALDEGEPVRERAQEILAEEERQGLADPATWLAFGAGIGRKIEIVRETMGRLARESRIWGYGAAGKATLWVNAAGMDYLEAVVDASPLRAGRLMPGTHTPIVPPGALREGPPDYVFVTAWNYAALIRSKEAWYPGIWVTPLPELRFS